MLTQDRKVKPAHKSLQAALELLFYSSKNCDRFRARLKLAQDQKMKPAKQYQEISSLISFLFIRNLKASFQFLE